MKVIDILNKIANGEEIPNEIIQHCKVFEEDKYWVLCKGSHKCYEKKYINNNEDSVFLFDYLTCDMLTDEVEIIEEDKKIEKIRELKTFPSIDDEEYAYEDGRRDKNVLIHNQIEKLFIDKINEIIEVINEKI